MKKVIWEQPPQEIKLINSEVHLWQVNLNISPPKILELIETLSSDEKVRANRFKFAEHKNRFIAARGYLRFILSQYLSINSYEIIFNYSDRGKPELPNCQLQFNLSHTQDIALYAISNCYLIGVDVEYIPSQVEFTKIAERFFTPAESRLINSLNPDERGRTFFQLWTMKEAYLKAIGMGLGGGLETVEIGSDDRELKIKAIANKTEEVENWFFSSFIPQDDFIGTIAVKNRQQPLIVKQFILN